MVYWNILGDVVNLRQISVMSNLEKVYKKPQSYNPLKYYYYRSEFYLSPDKRLKYEIQRDCKSMPPTVFFNHTNLDHCISHEIIFESFKLKLQNRREISKEDTLLGILKEI